MASFVQQYILREGLKVFGKPGYDAAMKEIEQLHSRESFEPVAVDKMTAEEKKKAVEALMFLTEKRDGRIKGRQVYNGKPTRKWLSQEDSASPTASLESIFLTAAIDAREKRDVMTLDVPNAFVQTPLEYKDGDEKIIMKITGVLVDMLLEVDPMKYKDFVVFKKRKKSSLCPSDASNIWNAPSRIVVVQEVQKGS